MSKHIKKFEMSRLNNGLQLIGEYNSASQSAAIGFFVRTGSRDEVSAEAGVSHFLEHMMFKGTKSKSALEITYALGNIGAQANAFTSNEMTVFYAGVLTEYLPEMQALLSDMLRPALNADDFDTEKNVILEEIALYQDRPHFYLFENSMRDYFGDHVAGNSVLGSTQSIAALTREQMLDYFKRRYAPNNMVLVASGNFDWAQFLDSATELCSGWQEEKTVRLTVDYSRAPIQREYKKRNASQAHLALMCRGPSAQSPERYAFNVFSNIIGDGTGSKFYWALVNKGLAESAGAEVDEMDGTGCFMVHASTEPAKLEQVASTIKDILLDATNFSDQELERAKTKIAARIVLGGELPMGRLMALGGEWLYREHLSNLNEVVDSIKAVSRDDILKVIGGYLPKEFSEFRLLPE